jgi:PAS domain S-box-containing protein
MASAGKIEHLHNESRKGIYEALLSIGQDLVSTVDLDTLLERILNAAQKVFHFDNALIRLVDMDRGVLEAVASFGYSDEAISREIALGQGVMGRAALRGAPVLIADLKDEKDYVPGIDGARCELAVPMLARDKVIGVFNVESTSPNAFSEDDIEPLLALAGQAAIAIDNARLYQGLNEMSEQNRELMQLNKRIIGSTDLGIYTVNTDLRITSWNRRMAEMSGISQDDAAGKELSELFPSLDAEGVMARIQQVLSSGESEKLELVHRTLQGQLRFQKRRLAPLKDEEGISGVVVIVEDITEFKNLLEQTIHSEKLAEVGRMSAALAHEINNPLGVIAYAAELMLREEDVSSFSQEMLERIVNESERMKTLTGSLLSFSRARETRWQEVDVNYIVYDVLKLVKYELEKNSVEIELECDHLPEISADPNKLKQVLINLLLNSVHVMSGGGTVRVETRVVEEGSVEVLITDSGPGVPEEIRETIFEPFFSTKKEGVGTGLGLYICRNILEEHGGSINLEEPGDSGAVFRLVLPVRPLSSD